MKTAINGPRSNPQRGLAETMTEETGNSEGTKDGFLDALESIDAFPVRPHRIDVKAVYDLLSYVAERFAKSVDLQVQIAETLVFVKDEVVAVRDKQSAISKRLKALEEFVGVRVHSSQLTSELNSEIALLSERVQAAASSVNSVREDVAKAMQLSAFHMETNKLTKLAEALGKIHGEIEILKGLASEGCDDE